MSLTAGQRFTVTMSAMILALIALQACGGGGTSETADTVSSGQPGMSSSALASLPTSTAATAQAPAITAPAVVRASDVLATASAALPLATQDWGYECYGATQAASMLGATGVDGKPISGSPSLRLGIENPPGSPTLNGIALRVAAGDPETAGAPRCELSFVGGNGGYLPKGSTFWFVTTMWLEDWRGTNDEQLVAQFHDGDWSRGLNPFFALLIRGNQARINVRWDTTQTQTIAKTNVANTDIWSDSFDFSERWVTFVVQARTSTKNVDAPFIKVWRDGQLIAERHGPLGYNQPDFRDYAKVGYYHWLSGNAWDMRMPVRTVFVRSVAVVSDPLGLYTESSIRSSVEQ